MGTLNLRVCYGWWNIVDGEALDKIWFRASQSIARRFEGGKEIIHYWLQAHLIPSGKPKLKITRRLGSHNGIVSEDSIHPHLLTAPNIHSHV